MTVLKKMTRLDRYFSIPRWGVVTGAVLLSWSLLADEATAQVVSEDSGAADRPSLAAKAKKKPRPRSFGRTKPATIASANSIEPAPLPPLPELPPLPTESRPTAPEANPSPLDPEVKPSQLTNYNGYSYENIGNISIGSEANDSFLKRLGKAYFDNPPGAVAEDSDAPPSRRGLPAPFTAPPMPFSDFIGPNIGVNDTSVFPLMDALYKGPNGKAWKDSQLKIYGWTDLSYNASTSRGSNAPLAYNIVPNRLELSQQVVVIERTIDTVQQDHFDWGFRTTNLYGIDYRYTTAKGWFSDQLLKHNHLYGWDPLQLHLDFYFPHIADGTVMRVGRYISPLDIEAQLSPDNFLYTHSLMFAYDPYTFTGIQFTTRFDDNWTMIYGIHAGNDVAPWTTSASPNAEILVKWVAPNNKDSIYGGLDSIGKGYYSHDHDDLQVFGFTWSHKFNEKWTTMTEQYYIWQRNALAGGTVTNGTPQPYFMGTGPGKLIPGLSDSYGVVNYTSYVLDDKSLLVFRSSCLADFQGQRTGIAGSYFEHTIGYIRHLNPWTILRPEVRYEYTSGQRGYDNGTRRDQFTFNCDLIVRF